ncbi:MAG: transcription-repair coupling factor, partial [Alphaproteobacteria bacterium]
MTGESDLTSIVTRMGAHRPLTVTSVPDGMAGLVLGDLAAALGAGRTLFVARDGQRLAEVARGLRFFAPQVEVLEFPAWDCLPYDRVSPHAAVVATRMATLARLQIPAEAPQIVLTTINAAIQRTPSRAFVAGGTMSAAAGRQLPMAELIGWLDRNGFLRATTVREAGEYAVRGGILDLFAAGADEPLRFDFFGDTLESIRTFDVDTQRTTGARPHLDLVPVSEMALTAESIARFRTGYVAEFGAAEREDVFYQAVSEGRRHTGMEHWLPLFAEELATVFDHLDDGPVVIDNLVEEALGERLDEITDHYEARRAALEEAPASGGAPYKALAPERLYLGKDEWSAALALRPVVRINPFSQPPSEAVIDLEARDGRSFAAERTAEKANVFDAVADHAATLQRSGKRVIIACWSEG